MKTQEKENLCRKCGRCCHAKRRTIFGSVFLDPYNKCEYLTKDNLCSIYEKRLEINSKECISLEQALEENYTLPIGGPYIQEKPGYKGCTVISKKEYNDILNQEYAFNIFFP